MNFNISNWNDLSYEQTKLMIEFQEIVNLSRSALNIDEDLTKLSKLYLKYKMIIKKYKKHKIIF